ncbi:MAG: hypothetical protein HXY45_01390 [Syntrophaceae bacterium]|nr:hypothetical protein [Syntrophaceae bacterium]
MNHLFAPTTKRVTSCLILLLVGLVSLPFVSVLSSGGGKVLSYRAGDVAQQFYAYRSFIHEEFRNGRFPLWNPYILSGTNFHGEGQPALLYPPTWLFSFLSPETAINWYFYAHSLLLALALFFYLRELGLTKESSFLGSLIFAISSVPILRIYPGHLPNYPALALAPLFLLFWEKFLTRGGVRPLLLLSLVYACLILSGHAQSLLYFSIFFLFYSMWTIAAGKGTGRKTKRTLALIASLSLGILLASAHLLPAWDFAQNSFRQRMTYEFCSQFSYAPENFLTLLYPSLFGDHARTPYWGRNNLWEMTAYLGVIPLVFAGLGAFFSKHPRKVCFLAAAVFFSLLALGGHTPLFYLLYKFVPLFDKFRGNSKYITIVVFSLSTLAAFGFELLFSKQEGRANKALPPLKKIFKTGMGISLALALFSILFFWILSDSRTWNSFVQWRYDRGETIERSILKDEKGFGLAQKTARESIALTGLLALGIALYFGFSASKKLEDLPAAKWLLLSGILADSFLFGAKYYVSFPIREIQPPREIVETLSQEKNLFRVMAPSLSPNTFMLSKIESVEGYVGNVADRYNRFINRAQGIPEERLQTYARVAQYNSPWKLLNVLYVILPSTTAIQNSPLQRWISSEGLTVYQSHEFIPRVYFPKRIQFVGTSGEALALATQEGFDPRDLTILEDRERAGQRIEYGESPPNFQVLKYASSEILLQVQSSEPRLIVVANSFDPNWKISIDGRKAGGAFPANYVLQGFSIPGGNHLLSIFFSPDSLKAGFFLSAVGFLVWVLWWVRSKPRPNE